jgi:ribosome maturation factor RimP
MEEKIKAFIENILEEEKGLFLVDFIKKGNDSQSKILVLIDGDKGVTIDQCASISRRTSHYIDEEIDSELPFRLEVSSAGLDHPLKQHRQYFKNIGKNIKVWLLDENIIEGNLIKVNAEDILLEKIEKKVKEEISIKFSQIDKTLVLVSFKK